MRESTKARKHDPSWASAEIFPWGIAAHFSPRLWFWAHFTKKLFQNSWLGVIMAMKQCSTLTISSGTRDPKLQPFLYTAKSIRASATAGAPISKTHKKWSYWSVKSAPTRPYVCNTWSPHLPWVCGTHNSNPGLKIGAFLGWNATIIHIWLS